MGNDVNQLSDALVIQNLTKYYGGFMAVKKLSLGMFQDMLFKNPL